MAKRIMIADDEKEIVALLQDYFELLGYETITAENGTQVLQKLDQSPDLILLDINMPEIDGIEVCKRIRPFSLLPYPLSHCQGGGR